MSKKPSSKTGPKNRGWSVGKSYLVRGVTNYIVGRLVSIDEHELIFEDASWVADTGRFHTALNTGTLGEVEPFKSDVIVGRGSICDATEWTFRLPRVQK